MSSPLDTLHQDELGIYYWKLVEKVFIKKYIVMWSNKI